MSSSWQLSSPRAGVMGIETLVVQFLDVCLSGTASKDESSKLLASPKFLLITDSETSPSSFHLFHHEPTCSRRMIKHLCLMRWCLEMFCQPGRERVVKHSLLNHLLVSSGILVLESRESSYWVFFDSKNLFAKSLSLVTKNTEYSFPLFYFGV